jgi:hypothetical protein
MFSFESGKNDGDVVVTCVPKKPIIYTTEDGLNVLYGTHDVKKLSFQLSDPKSFDEVKLWIKDKVERLLFQRKNDVIKKASLEADRRTGVVHLE